MNTVIIVVAFAMPLENYNEEKMDDYLQGDELEGSQKISCTLCHNM